MPSQIWSFLFTSFYHTEVLLNCFLPLISVSPNVSTSGPVPREIGRAIALHLRHPEMIPNIYPTKEPNQVTHWECNKATLKKAAVRVSVSHHATWAKMARCLRGWKCGSQVNLKPEQWHTELPVDVSKLIPSCTTAQHSKILCHWNDIVSQDICRKYNIVSDCLEM